MKMNGEGSPINLPEAITWYRWAADGGNAEAQYALGLFDYLGAAKERDSVQAIKWFELAAKGGNRNAQYNLGKIYSAGDGVPADMFEAYKWFYLATSSAHDEARYYLASLAAKMSQEAIASATAAALAWSEANRPSVRKPST